MKANVEKWIKNFVKGYSHEKKALTLWKEPLVAYADAKDEMFGKLKELVSPTHGLPGDFLEDAQTVIAYFIPFTEPVVESNIKGRESSRDWAVAYIETNQLIFDLNMHIQERLKQSGYRSSIIPATHNFDTDKLISDWSHRHVAFIAGLGKFGLNHMLITEKGCCGRIGSIVTNAKIEPTERKEEEFCLYKHNGTCKKCVRRCVAGALHVDSFDRFQCYEMCLRNDNLFKNIALSDVCGKCTVGVPCSFENPVKSKKYSGIK